MIGKILLGVALVLAVLAVVIATRPPTYHIERSVAVAAPPEAVFAPVNDFHSWPAWSPWEKLDPQMKKTFDGAPAGVGAIYSWSGNNKVGEGRMTMEKSERPSLISIKLEFLKPFASTSTATFTFAPDGQGTKATWAMDGNNNFVGKAFGLFMNMDKMMGGDFDRGLASLKVIAESAPKGVPAAAAAK
jgi:uncharacterized protein YndB with AHSA1/START domain